jgi:hypothetical protein
VVFDNSNSYSVTYVVVLQKGSHLSSFDLLVSSVLHSSL